MKWEGEWRGEAWMGEGERRREEREEEEEALDCN